MIYKDSRSILREWLILLPYNFKADLTKMSHNLLYKYKNNIKSCCSLCKTSLLLHTFLWHLLIVYTNQTPKQRKIPIIPRLIEPDTCNYVLLLIHLYRPMTHGSQLLGFFLLVFWIAARFVLSFSLFCLCVHDCYGPIQYFTELGDCRAHIQCTCMCLTATQNTQEQNSTRVWWWGPGGGEANPCKSVQNAIQVCP